MDQWQMGFLQEVIYMFGYYKSVYCIIGQQYYNIQELQIIMDPELDHELQEQIQTPSQQKIKKDFIAALDVLSKKSPSNIQVKKYNTIIISHLSELEGINVLIQLLIFSQGNQIRCNLIVSFICYYVKAQVRPGVGIIRHDKKGISNKIKSLFFCQTISNKCKRMLSNGYREFLSELNTDFIKIRRNLCEEIVDFFYKKQGMNHHDLASILYLIQAVTNDSLQSQSLRLLQQNLLVRFIKLSLQLTREITKMLTIQNQAQSELTAKITWALRVFKITSLLFTSANIDKLFVLKKTIILSPDLANLCIETIKISSDGQSFILNNEMDKYNQDINQIKVQLLKLLNDQFKFMLKSKKNLGDAKYVPVMETVKEYIKYVVPALARQLDGFPKKSIASEQLLKQALFALTKAVSIPGLLDMLTQIRDIVLFKICLPCILTTPEQRQLSPQDFCQKREKLVNFENAITPHQAAVSLIEAYADQIYGSVPFLVKSMINFMDFQLTADPQYFDLIPPLLMETDFYKNHTYFQQIQTGLSVLAMMSYHADHRDDITVNVESFLVRRQQFFSRVDVSQQLIVSFLHFCSYYLQNFYQLILQGKANANFHQSLIFHTLQLLYYSYSEQNKNFSSNQSKKIAIQSIDFISNVVVQPYFFSAIFPAWNQKSPEMLISLFQRLSPFIRTSINIKIIDTIFIDFVQRCIERNYKDKNNWAGIPSVVKKQLCQLFVIKIGQNFRTDLPNQTIAKQKLMQLYSLILIYCEQPCKLLSLSIPLFTHIIQKQYSFIQQLIDIFQVFCQRAAKNNNNHNDIPAQIQQILTKTVLRALKISDNQTYQNQVFDVVLNCNILKIGQEQIMNILLQVFQQRLQEKAVDEQAENVMQKTLYLMIQIGFCNFNLVSPHMWMRVLDVMIEYMRVYYKTNDTMTVGKATCICLCCYIQDPQGMEIYMQNRLEGLWDCILDDQLKYLSRTQKKVACIVLLNLLTKYSHRPIIKDKYISIVRTCCIIMYYIYQKPEISYRDNQSDDDQMNDNQSKSDDDEKKKPWKQPLHTMRSNPFLENLPDERVLLKNICVKLNQTEHDSFQKFILDLPIGLQNLVKNKILMYRQDTAVANKTKMRTILKVKKLDL